MLSRQQYRNAPAVALIGLAEQLIKFGGNDEALGVKITDGVCRGLGTEVAERYPVCPFCGRRHP
jgi:hypothetical protein